MCIVTTLPNFEEAAKWIVEWIKVRKNNATVRYELTNNTYSLEFH
jgi:hypothetical protein